MPDRPFDNPSDPPRRRARELVLQALYSAEFGTVNPQEALTELLKEQTLPDGPTEFARKLFASTLRRAEWANEKISGLAVNWNINRIAAIDRVILRMALIELDEHRDTPVKVILNEAIELAKKFSTAESSGFVNGILDSYVKRSERNGESTGNQ